MEWRIAAGEAEAELAEMTVRGEIDAVLSDDVDNFLFGAKMVIRNMSKTLSANKSKVALKRKATLPETSSPMKRTSSFDPSLSTQYEDVPAAFDRSLVTFSYDDILSTTGLCREDMILVALMSGGDYSEGIKGCGVTTAKKLAEAGFGRKLLSGIKLLEKDQIAQQDFLRDWREEVAEVLRTNPASKLEGLSTTAIELTWKTILSYRAAEQEGSETSRQDSRIRRLAQNADCQQLRSTTSLPNRFLQSSDVGQRHRYRRID